MATILHPAILKKRVLWHLLFWIGAVFYLAVAFRLKNESFVEAIYPSLVNLPGHIFFVYVLLYFLIPRYILERRFVSFILLLIPVVLICSLYSRYVATHVFSSKESFTDSRIFMRSIFANFNLCGIAVAIKLARYWYRERQAKQEAEKRSLQSQLELLKSQVHPHFLFNTLNNLYSLTLEGSSTAPVIVLKLSSLLRYMLYECGGETIALEKEIAMLRNYIELEQIRYGRRLDLSFSVEGTTKNKSIAPLLLLPLVENCFKHGLSEQIDVCWIALNLAVNDETLLLKLTNSKRPGLLLNQEGIGLRNVRKDYSYYIPILIILLCNKMKRALRSHWN